MELACGGKMKIGIVGLGYVGIVTAAVLASKGHEIYGIDIDEAKITALRSGKSPIYEPGLQDLIDSYSEQMHFSTDYSALVGVEVVYLTLPTPTKEGKIDLSYLKEGAMKACKVNPDAILCIKSTVVPGTAASIRELTGSRVVSNPEFTREGNAVNDTLNPDRIVIGGDGGEEIRRIWNFARCPFIMTNNENAELIKYASNAFLASKISFINEFANLCEVINGADVNIVAEGMGLDRRIAPYFLKAGLGFGGSCFPKDTRAILSFALEKGIELSIVKSAIEVNENRIVHVISMIQRRLGDIAGKAIVVLGLAFKEDTDDIRESRAIILCNKLSEMGAIVRVYDPVIKADIAGFQRLNSLEESLNSDFIVVATEWPEFRNLSTLRPKIPVLDARRILNQSEYQDFLAVGLGE